MPDIKLSDLYSQMQFEMLGKLRVSALAFKHPGTKGDATEANWIDWFKDYLPKRYRADKGIVIDCTGRESQQMDVIIYDAHYSHLVFHRGNMILVPAESVYAVFEVKQNLNQQNFDYAIDKAKSVRELYRTSAPIKHAGGHFNPKELHEILAGLLSTTCDWKEPITEHIAANVKTKERQERLDFVCSITNSTFVIDNNTFVNEFNADESPAIRYCKQGECLVFFLLNLLKKLQDIGTVPAIEFSKYAEGLNEKYY